MDDVRSTACTRSSQARCPARSCCSSAAHPARSPHSAIADPTSPQQLGAALGLAVPELPWHAHRDRLATLACALGVAIGTMGKIARDVALLAQTEVAEAFESAADGRGGSSTMPQKRNPVGASVVLAAALRAPALVATMLAAMPQEHERGLGGWQAEWETMPELVHLAGGAAKHMADMLAALEVDVKRMRAKRRA